MTAERHEPSRGEPRAWGWVAHLREGGTTPWSRWPDDGTGEATAAFLPGAQQLELLRRLNEAGPPSPALAARVLASEAPGRGRPDLGLSGVGEPSPFGPPPVDPGDLPDDEMLRLVSGLVAEDVVAAGLPRRPAPARGRPWHTRYRLVGDPVLADPVRAELVARGRPPGRRGGIVVVLGTDLATMVVDAWTARSLEERAPAWEQWLASFVDRDAVPPRADVARAARTWAERVGRDRVHVVLDRAALPHLVGVRRLPAPPAPLPADGIELARRVSAVLGVLVGPEQRTALLAETLRPRLATAPGEPLVVPAEHEAWLDAGAERMRHQLRRAGYAVHGRDETLLPQRRPGVAAPSEAGALALALGLLLGRPLGRDEGEEPA